MPSIDKILEVCVYSVVVFVIVKTTYDFIASFFIGE